jgi:hypothetical protein
MTQNVSVPEKTLEHWASLCVAYRYRSLAAQWWPVNGVDIDLQALPTQPGKAIQLELKTITPAGPGRHKVWGGRDLIRSSWRIWLSGRARPLSRGHGTAVRRRP